MPYDDGVSDEQTAPEAPVVEALETAVQAAIAAMAGMPPRRAFALATRLRDLFGDTWRAEMETQRALQVRRIRRDEELDLEPLGESLGGLSKQRVSQMIKHAKAVQPAPVSEG